MTFFEGRHTKCEVCGLQYYAPHPEAITAKEDLCSECKKAVQDATEQRQYLFAPHIPLGPSCLSEGCSGVLYDNADWNKGEFFRQCSICKAEYDREPIKQKTEEAIRFIGSVFGKKE